MCKICEKVNGVDSEFRHLKSKPKLLFIKRDTPLDEIKDVEFHELVTDKKLRSELRTHFDLDNIGLPTPMVQKAESIQAYRVELE